MGKQRDRKIPPEEAKKDADRLKMNTRTIQEKADLYDEKGMKTSPKDKDKLEDKDLAAVAGGYIPLFDECLQRYEQDKCYYGATIFNRYSGCPNCKLVDIKKGRSNNRVILSCTKGYFTNIEGPITWDEFVR
jgi:hypothetical protein